MRLLIHGLALLAVALPTGKTLYDGRAHDSGATCRAELVGDELTTAIEFQGGYTVEGPWKVVWSRSADAQEAEHGRMVGATLDRVVELDPATGERLVSAFPQPIETTFEGRDDDELVHHAARVWCMVVLKAHGQLDSGSPATQVPLRVALHAGGRGTA